MLCPSCGVSFSDSHLKRFGEAFFAGKVQTKVDIRWSIQFYTCAECLSSIVLLKGISEPIGYFNYINIAYPQGHEIGAKIAPDEVDSIFASDYNEAAAVLRISPKASAALSRRCLQNVLREKAAVKKSDLAKEIQEVIDSNKLPSYISDGIDAIRNIGNFAAHPLKSQSIGEIVDVEAGEAEWSLEVLDLLFDFYFVQPISAQKKKDALNQKLLDMGKPAMK